MADKEDKFTIAKALDKWARGEYGKSFTVTYHVVVNLDQWPIILWDREDWPCDTDKDEFEHVVANFVKDFGLNQGTLCDTYREHGADVSITRRRRG